MPYGVDQYKQDVVEGSIFDHATNAGKKPEEVLSEADIIVMIDVSSSMGAYLGDGETRYEKAVKELKYIQRTFSGRIAVISFNSSAKLELGGVPQSPAGMTHMMKALEMASVFDGPDTKFFMISDGEPNGASEGEIIAYAKQFEAKIDCIFIGEDNDVAGQEFLRQLAEATGGTNTGRIDPKMLADTMKLLITGK